jgi:molecular chaperone DnaK
VDNVILVGGSTRMPFMRALVAEHFGRAPHTRIDPDLVVAQGAAIHAYAVGGGAALTPTAPPPPVATARAIMVGAPPLEPEPELETLEPEPELETLELDELLPVDPSVPPPPSIPPPSLPPLRADDTELSFLLEERMGMAPSLPPQRADATEVDLKLPSAMAPPLLLDVTPQSLGIETAGGYCAQLIARNAPIPAEQTRTFGTARDDQETVMVRVCQGESRLFAENQLLGEVQLSGLRPAPRGEVGVDVSFHLDADGSLAVKATDSDTGQLQTIRIQLLGGADEADIAAMRARQEQALHT